MPAVPRFTPENPAKIHLIGYFGHSNLGDDLMLEALLERFESSPSVARVTVDMHADTIGAWSGKSRPLTGFGLAAKARRVHSLLRSNCVVWGGGTCLYDAGDNTGMARLLRYTRLARAMGKPVYFVNIGIGRLESKNATELARAILQNASGASFRDERSYALAQDLAPSGRYTLGGDLATLRGLPVVPKKSDAIGTVAFSGVREALQHPEIVQATARSLGELARQGVKINFIPFHGGAHSDHVFHKAVAKDLPVDSYTLAEVNSAQDAASHLIKSDFHVGMRLHSVVLADLVGVPGMGLAFHPKVRYYAERQGGCNRIAAPSEGFSFEHIKKVLAGYSRPSEALAQEQAAALAGLRDLIPA